MTINVLQLAAGKGSRFSYFSKIPKPFLPLNDTSMFRAGIDSLKFDNNEIRYHFLFQEKHIKCYNPEKYIDDLDYNIHTIDYFTDGAATSAAHVINHSMYIDQPWLIVDCDFLLDYNLSNFKSLSNKSNSIIFVEENPWILSSSYSCTDAGMNVLGVAEKQAVSKYRNTGQYYWQNGNLFMECYNFFKNNNLVINGEFYIAPLYNYAIQQQNSVKAFLVNKYDSVGTPEEYLTYLGEIDG